MVLDNLGSSLKNAFKKITGMGVVDKEAVEAVVKDLQRALIMADVDVSLVSELSNKIKKKVIEGKPPVGMTIKEYFIRILYDELVAFLGSEAGTLELKKQRIMTMGLFASGKTTTIGKLAKWFKTRGLKPGLIACDTHRAAAQEQLRQLGKKLDVPVYSDGKNPEDIAKKAISKAKEDVLIFDTAGRDALDKELAKELTNLDKIIKPNEKILVIPADIGQAARRQSEEFNRLVGITGVIVTKLDGTAKGGGALVATAISGAKIKFIGVGEKQDDFESYDPKRFVSKLIGYGDIQGLLDKAKQAGFDQEAAEKMMKGNFTMNEFLEQIKGMKKMGSLSSVMDMIPGMGKVNIPKGMLDVQEEKMEKWAFIITSMTPKEKEEPDIIKASRIKRIARGSGCSEASVRELLKHYKQTKKMMKLAKGGKGMKRGPLANLAKQFGLKV